MLKNLIKKITNTDNKVLTNAEKLEKFYKLYKY